MSKSIIRHISELPAWFKLEKYNEASSLDSYGWHNNLLVRYELLKVIDKDTFKKALELNKSIPLGFMSDLNQLRSNPISKDDKLFILSIYSIRRFEDKAVRILTIGDLYEELKKIDIDKQNYAKNIILNTEDSEGYWHALYHTETKKEWTVNPLLEKLSCNLLHVRCELPEKLLVEQFRMLIRKIQYKRVNKTPNFDSWIDFGVLPYLDLKIWEKESKKSIPNSVMANAIFPPSDGGEEVVRKTTKKIVSTLLTQSYLMYLESYAANENAEKSID